ncbi:hypothetical protein FHG87_016285 [Trinorchestia longiramus]|nr:hypothetical protein FHG87_016285 [Trinorchestia longiramus]
MCYHDGMEAVFLHTGGFVRFATQQSDRRTSFSRVLNRQLQLRKISGQLQVLLVLILLVSPSFTKPVKPVSLHVPRTPSTPHQTKDSAKEQSSTLKSSPAADSHLHQLTLDQQFPASKRRNLHHESTLQTTTHSLGIENSSPTVQPQFSVHSDSTVQLEDKSSQVNRLEFSVRNTLSSQSISSLSRVKAESLFSLLLNEITDSIPDSSSSNRKLEVGSSLSLESPSKDFFSGKIKPTLVTKAFRTPLSKKTTSSNLRPVQSSSSSSSKTVLEASPSRQSESSPETAFSRGATSFNSLVGLSFPSSISSNNIVKASAIPAVVTQVVSRVPRHTAEPATRLEDPTYRDAATLLESAQPTGMDSPDNVARTGRNSGSSSSGSSGERSAHWSSPCRIDTAVNPNSSPAYFSENIYHSINVAHKHAHRFKDTFASQLWHGQDWYFALTMVPEESYEFLNRLSIPTEEELQSMDFKAALAVAYESMQRRAVAIEQVTLDQALYRDLNDTDFLSEFRSMEGEIVSILCELHYAMKQLQVRSSEVITSEIMHEKYRDLDISSDRLERDTIILREYISGLDYLVRVFDHFRSQST